MDRNKIKRQDDCTILCAGSAGRPGTGVNTTDPAYIMYTSGSTGIPKGTRITHRNVLRIACRPAYVNITGSDTILSLSNYSFDGSVFDFFGALTNGATLVITPAEDILDVDRLLDRVQDQDITVFFSTTALFNRLVDTGVDRLRNVRKNTFWR